MERMPTSTYRIDFSNGISEETLLSLMMLYQPLIGKDATVLYLTLIAEGKTQKGFEKHQRLLVLADLDINALDKACTKLEEYMLMRTYVKTTELCDQYIYVLNSPIHTKDFLKSNVFMNRYERTVGKDETTTTMTHLNANNVSLRGYKEVTKAVKFLPEDLLDRHIEFDALQPRYQFAMDDQTINFDYEKFIATTSTLVFPAELRTQENLSLIGKLATIYGLSVDKMRVLVNRCINLQTMTFDGAKLKIYASRAESDVKPGSDPYSLPPVSFLQAKQGGAKVTQLEKSILEHLAIDMHFSNEVINVMIEHILKISQNRLNRNFVDMVAAEWARDGVTTKQQALQQRKKLIRQTPQVNSGVKIGMPEYIRQQEEGTLPEGTVASAELLERLQKLQKGDA